MDVELARVARAHLEVLRRDGSLMLAAGVDGVTSPPWHVLVEQERRKGLTAVED